MNGAIWIVFAVAAVVCTWLESSKEEDSSQFNWLTAVVGVLGIGVLYGLTSQFVEAKFDLPLGAFVAALLAIGLSKWNPKSIIGLLAAGAVASQSILTQTQATVVSGQQISSVFMIFAIVGWVGACLAWGGNARGGTAFAGMGALVAIADHWVPEGFGKVPNTAGSLLAIGVVAAGILVLALRRGKGGPNVLLAGGLGSLIIVGAGFFVGQWGGDDATLPVTIFASVLAAFAVVWMVGSSNSSQRTTQLVLGGLIWMGVATFAFAQDKTFGLSLALVSGFGAFVLLGRVDLTAVMGPVVGLAAYRTLREQFPDITRGFDIAQHYGMVGLMIGAGLIVLLLGSPRLLAAGVKNWARFGVLALMVGMAAVVGLFFFGVKGSVGLIIGLGIGVWMAGVTSDRGAYGISPLVGLAGLIGLSYGEVSQSFDLAREPKMMIFVWSSVILIVLAAILVFALSDRKLGEGVGDENLKIG
jgi:hypothetical protein